MVVTFEFRKYGYEKYFIFDYEEWKDRVFIEENEPEKALQYLSKLLLDKNVCLKCSVDIVDLFNMCLKNKINDIIF